MARKTAPSANGVRRQDIEEWLDNSGLTWSFDEAFAVADIDRDKSLQNQARLGDPLDDELVDQYREALRRGDKFPAIVAARGGAKSKAVNIDGNHRLEAALLEGVATFGTYVVKSRPNTLQVHTMTQQANVHHGKTTAKEDRIQHAIWQIKNQGVSVERAAANVNLPTSVVRNRWDKVRADQRADDVGLRRIDWDTLNPSVKTRLLSVGTDEGFKAAARLAIAAQMSAAQVDDLVSAVNEFPKSAAKQEKVVRALRKDYADRIAQVAAGVAPSGRKLGFTPRRRLGLALSNVDKLPDDFEAEVLEAFRDDEEERHKAATRAREAAHRLESLAAALEG